MNDGDKTELAFPCNWLDIQPDTGAQVVRQQYYGMTLCDYFAGQALAGLIPNAAWNYSSGPCNSSAVERCYALADAMIAERSK